MQFDIQYGDRMLVTETHQTRLYVVFLGGTGDKSPFKSHKWRFYEYNELAYSIFEAIVVQDYRDGTYDYRATPSDHILTKNLTAAGNDAEDSTKFRDIGGDSGGGDTGGGDTGGGDSGGDNGGGDTGGSDTGGGGDDGVGPGDGGGGDVGGDINIDVTVESDAITQEEHGTNLVDFFGDPGLIDPDVTVDSPSGAPDVPEITQLEVAERNAFYPNIDATRDALEQLIEAGQISDTANEIADFVIPFNFGPIEQDWVIPFRSNDQLYQIAQILVIILKASIAISVVFVIVDEIKSIAA